MRSDAPALLPVFRSRHQAELLALVLLHPDHEYTVTELAQRLGVPLSTLHRELQRLVEAELLTSRAVGRSRLVRANPEHPATEALTRLLEVTFGPHSVIADEFADVAGVSLVLIYGSWAARYHGAHGAPPADLDVLVVGTPDRADVYDAADRAQARLSMQVNPVIRTPDQWSNATDRLLQQIQASPTVPVLGSDPAAA